ncbi:MAG: LapA family protein [Bacteroidales bacterium]
MINLYLATFLMMLFTFLIGFLVAGVIKLTALAADKQEYLELNKDEIKRAHQLKKIRIRRIKQLLRKIESGDPQYIQEYYHGVSKGDSHYTVLDYYYSPKASEQTPSYEHEEDAPDYKISKEK